MIILNFYPGSMGFLLAKIIYFHWQKQHFSDRKVGYMPAAGVHSFSNHDVFLDIFLSDCSAISSHDILLLDQKLSTHTSIVAVHNISLIPAYILDNSVVINIQCHSDIARVHATFLYWIKSGNYQIEYAEKSANIRDDFYNLIFEQMIICFNRPFSLYKSGITVDFDSLSNYNAVKTMLSDLATRMSFTMPVFDESWYLTQYKRSTDPIRLYPHILEMFSLIYHRIQPSDIIYNYYDFFTEQELIRFRAIVDDCIILTK